LASGKGFKVVASLGNHPLLGMSEINHRPLAMDWKKHRIKTIDLEIHRLISDYLLLLVWTA
jgi:hypothetical protein